MRKTLIILAFFIHIVSAQYHQLHWGQQANLPDRINLGLLTKWNSNIDSSHLVDLPFVLENHRTLLLSNSFNIDASDSSSVWKLVSNGFTGHGRVKINGSYVADIAESYTKSKRNIPTGLIHPKKNNIEIILNKPDNFSTGFLTFAHLFSEPDLLGITRPFYLEKVQNKLISDFSYKILFKQGRFRVTYSYRLNKELIKNLAHKDGLALEDFIGGKKITHSFSSGAYSINGKIILDEMQLWSPGNPVMLSINIRLKRFNRVLADMRFKTGFKDVRMENRQMIFNARPVQVKGIVYHQNLLSLDGRKILPSYLNDLLFMKQQGFNAIRFAGHIPDDRVLALCDSIGLMSFVELPIINYPTEMFEQDNLLELTSKVSNNIFSSAVLHPSLTAIGLGSGILTHIAPVQKFYYILRLNIHKSAPLLSYLMPAVVSTKNTSANLADFYMLDIRSNLNSYLPSLKNKNHPFAMIAGLGPNNLTKRDNNPNIQARLSTLRNDLFRLSTDAHIQNGFIDAYADWICRTPQQAAQKKDGHYFINDGLVSFDRKLKQGATDETINPWKNRLSVGTSVVTGQKTNIFSIVLFFGLIVFFLFYRRYPRFSENFKRAMQHPYGFFVDMRERRIIPVFNTLVSGATSALVLATFCAAFIFYLNNTYYFQEFLSTISSNPSFNAWVLKFGRSPLLLTAGLFIVVYLHPVLIGLFLKILSLVTRLKLRLRQAVAIGMWAGIPWIFLFPIVLASYQLMLYGGFFKYLLILFILFNFWSFYRLVNGIRILTISRFRTVFMLLLLSYVIPIFTFVLFFEPHTYWFKYLKYLIQTAPLFNG